MDHNFIIDPSLYNNGVCRNQCSPILNVFRVCNGECFKLCPNFCKTLLVDGIIFTSPSPPSPELPVLPRPTIESQNINQSHLLTISMIIMGCLIGAALLVCIVCAIIRVKRRRRNSRRWGDSPLFFGTQEDFLDDDQWPQMFNPIWYIHTIGLQQSIIDSIAVFKYKKDEGLIDVTDCSVCLSEFEENEDLKLLPKCSHAFHVSCIDTWLRSHKNCPLCRAPIVSENFDAQIDSSTSEYGTTSEETHSENNQIEDENGSTQVRNEGDGLNCAVQLEDEANSSVLRKNCRVQSDLVQSRKRTEEEVELQPVRRSMSMDDSSAIEIYNLVNTKYQEKYLKSNNNVSISKNGNLRLGRLMKSCSIEHALHKGHVSMKRSFSSSGGKPSSSSSSSSSRHSRSHESILPL